jgi:hypothetical protein
MSDWHAVYDIRDSWPWAELCILLILVTATVGAFAALWRLVRIRAIARLENRSDMLPRWPQWVFACWFVVGGCVVTTGYSNALYQSLFLRSERAFTSANTIEGTIDRVDPVMMKGNTVVNERLHLGDKSFVIRKNRLGTGLTHLAAEGGPCQAGQQVRITYFDDAILRVERIH